MKYVFVVVVVKYVFVVVVVKCVFVFRVLSCDVGVKVSRCCWPNVLVCSLRSAVLCIVVKSLSAPCVMLIRFFFFFFFFFCKYKCNVFLSLSLCFLCFVVSCVLQRNT